MHKSCSYITDVGINAVVQSTKDLRCLIISKCTLLTDSFLLTLAQSECSATIRLLDVYRCTSVTDNGLTALARNCPNLSVLNLGDCGTVTSKLLEELGESSSLSKLREFYVTSNQVDAIPASFARVRIILVS